MPVLGEFIPSNPKFLSLILESIPTPIATVLLRLFILKAARLSPFRNGFSHTNTFVRSFSVLFAFSWLVDTSIYAALLYFEKVWELPDFLIRVLLHIDSEMLANSVMLSLIFSTSAFNLMFTAVV